MIPFRDQTAEGAGIIITAEPVYLRLNRVAVAGNRANCSRSIDNVLYCARPATMPSFEHNPRGDRLAAINWYAEVISEFRLTTRYKSSFWE